MSEQNSCPESSERATDGDGNASRSAENGDQRPSQGPGAADGSGTTGRARYRDVGRRALGNRLTLVGGTITLGFVVLALVAPVVAPYDPTAMNVPARLSGPSLAHPFGTDQYGRDILSRVVVGSRVAMQVALAVPTAAAAAGVPIGLVAGYFGGRVDDALMRLMDAVFAFPAVLLGLLVVAVFGQGLWKVILALSVVFVPQFARVTRSAALSAAREDHVEAADATGVGDLRIIRRHVLPFCLSSILVQATVTAALSIVVSASLSFLGVGVQPPRPSWGMMLRTGKGFLGEAWWFAFFPGVAIVLSVLGFNLLGDGLRDVLDPRTEPQQ